MERLRDGKPVVGSAEAELADALATLERIRSSPARQERVFQAVTARRKRPWSGAVLLRPAVAGVVLLVAGAATAGATVGRGWLARSWHQLVASRTASAPVAVAPPRPSPVPLVVTPPEPTEIAPPTTPEIAAPAARPVPVRVAAHPRPARGEDPSALVEAVRALRSDHDPQRAARLLDAYLRAYPRGALAEEALALQIEAASNLKSPRAAAFARQYLRAYPGGRFQQAARQALDGAGG
jgi:hypothetical protein